MAIQNLIFFKILFFFKKNEKNEKNYKMSFNMFGLGTIFSTTKRTKQIR